MADIYQMKELNRKMLEFEADLRIETRGGEFRMFESLDKLRDALNDAIAEVYRSIRENE